MSTARVGIGITAFAHDHATRRQMREADVVSRGREPGARARFPVRNAVMAGLMSPPHPGGAGGRRAAGASDPGHPPRARAALRGAAGGGANVVSAEVKNAVYLDSHAHYHVRLATGEELVAFQRVADGPAIDGEARVWVTWRTEDVRIVPA